jgi:hypothetical protein
MANEELVEVSETEVPGGEVVEEQEKMLPQSEVNRIVGRQKELAAQRATEKAEAEFQQRLSEMESQASNSMGGIAPSQEDIRGQMQSMLQEELQKQQDAMAQQRYQQEMERVANDYHASMATGPSMFEDFEKVTSEFKPEAFPYAVYLASQAENTPSLMYEMIKNPSKLLNIERLAEQDPDFAQRELMKLSNSIKENEKAKQDAQQQDTNSPLTRLTPNPVGTDNGAMTLRDLKKAPWLRG